MSLCLTLNASNGDADLRTAAICIAGSGWIFHVLKDRPDLIHRRHELSWTHGIASHQSAMCASLRGMRVHLNGCGVILGSRLKQKKERQPLMTLWWFCSQKNECFDTSAWRALGASWVPGGVTPGNYKGKLKQSQANFSALWFFFSFFWGGWFVFFVTSAWVVKN